MTQNEMAQDSVEIFVLDLNEKGAVEWLSAVFDELEPVRSAPIVTYEGRYGGSAVSVQITEEVENGRFTSLWFNGPVGPWNSTLECARAAHDALGAEVRCYPGPGQLGAGDAGDRLNEPWSVVRFVDGDEAVVDERQLDV